MSTPSRKLVGVWVQTSMALRFEPFVSVSRFRVFGVIPGDVESLLKKV